MEGTNMIQTNMLQPGVNGYGGTQVVYASPIVFGMQQQPTEKGPLLGGETLMMTEKVAISHDNSCFEKIGQTLCPLFHICLGCPKRYKVTTVDKGYKISDNVLFRVEESKCCCPSEWKLINAQTDQHVGTYTQKCCYLHACQLCLGGPGFDINDFNGTNHGSAHTPAFQCCDEGYDINEHGQNKYFVGNVCRCCEQGLYPSPIWNDDKSEIEKLNMHVMPCLKRYLPLCCFCLNSYYVADFPTHSKQVARAGFIAGSLLKH
jgi:hypothetical protein